MAQRLLIADDDNEIRELLEFDLSHSGYEVDSAKDGEEALHKALIGNYDLILLDVMMPKMNGFDVCKNIRLAKIKTITLLSTPISIPEENKALLDRQIACAPQYPMFKSDRHLIKVELTDKGKRLFERIYLYRPTPVSIEGNVYTFNCSAGQVLYYFERFGNNALITSPRKLGIDMRNYHYFALKKYNDYYKSRI